MPELRKDPVCNRWVLLAPQRATRPNEFAPQSQDRAPHPRGIPAAYPLPEDCPFCEGNESQTPAEIDAIRPAGTAANGPGWSTRVVPNRFPALEGTFTPLTAENVLYQQSPGIGAHEVMIESSAHLTTAREMDDHHFRNLVTVCQRRLLHFKHEGHWTSALWFKNVGPDAGASLAHAHSQLIVLPLLPPVLRDELAGSLSYHHRHGRCVFCDFIEQEQSGGPHQVAAAPAVLAFCPYASRFNYETWIVPRRHESHFEDTSPETLIQLAGVLRSVLVRIESRIGRASYNVILHSSPFDTHKLNHYHWHMEILPRISRSAGFEWGTGLAISTLPPHQAANLLREIQI
jgi:UDPglucose--hexose-1-phosphate uridylyltransferase